MGEYFDTAVLEPGKERLEGYAQAFQKLSDTFREMPTKREQLSGKKSGNFSGCAGNRMRVLQAQGNLLGAAVLPDIPTDLCLLKCSGDQRNQQRGKHGILGQMPSQNPAGGCGGRQFPAGKAKPSVEQPSFGNQACHGGADGTDGSYYPAGSKQRV